MTVSDSAGSFLSSTAVEFAIRASESLTVTLPELSKPVSISSTSPLSPGLLLSLWCKCLETFEDLLLSLQTVPEVVKK